MEKLKNHFKHLINLNFFSFAPYKHTQFIYLTFGKVNNTLLYLFNTLLYLPYLMAIDLLP